MLRRKSSDVANEKSGIVRSFVRWLPRSRKITNYVRALFLDGLLVLHEVSTLRVSLRQSLETEVVACVRACVHVM